MNENQHPHRTAVALWVACACLVPLDGQAADVSDTPPCLKGKEIEKLRTSSLWSAVGKALWGEQCGAVVKVLTQLQANKVPGGRKLHEGKPLDRTVAQAELQKARTDPDFTSRLAAASAGVTDPTGRLVVEAALLDDDGYFAARQLLMEDILKAQEAR